MLNLWSQRLVRGCVFLFLLALFSTLTPTRSAAQWQENAWNFPAQVIAIEFYDNGAIINLGFVGLANGEIWKTDNEGATWTAMDAPKTGTGAISGFAFKDRDNGWASWYDLDKGQGGVLRTTDAGATWTAQSTHLPVIGIYYHATNSSLFISQYSASGAPIRRSVDDGANWTDMLSTNNRVRFSFWDNQQGLVGLTPIGFSGDQVSRTMNGGLAWTPVNLDTNAQFETDQPLAVPATRLGYMVGNFDDAFMAYRTSNRGASWQRVHTFPQDDDWALTTHMENTCSALWIQATNGMLFSTTLGETWINISGPQNTPADIFVKQFAFSERLLWAADNQGNLWNYDKPIEVPQTRIRMDKRFVRINSTRCQSLDSNLWMMLPNMCDPYVITKLTMSGSPDISLKNPPTLPFQMGGRDSLAFSYASDDFNRDSAYVKIEYTVDGVAYDTTMLIIGERFRQMNAQLSYNTMRKEVNAACTKLDTTFTITNTPCDDLQIVSAWLTDSSLFRIVRPNFPVNLAPNGTESIRITAAASVQGTYTSKLMVRFQYAGQMFDTAIALEYRVKTGPVAPVIPAMQFVIDNPCVRYDTVVRWLNRLCGDLRLDSVTITPPDGVMWRLSGAILGAQAELMRFPISIQGPSKGKHTVKVKLSFTDFEGAIFDTTITINYEIKNGIPTKINMPPTFVFRSTSVCAPREQMLYIENTLCEPITLQGDSWITQDPTITKVSGPAYPVVLEPNEKDSILLRFAPTAAGNVPASIRVSYRVQSTDQISQVNITGIGTTTANAIITDSTLSFPEVMLCEPTTELFTHLTNDGCEAITLASIARLAGDNFELVEPASLPVTVAPGDSIKLVFRPKKKQGQFHDSIDVVYRSVGGGADQAARLRLQSSFLPGIRSIDMQTLFVFDSIPLCGSPKDTLIRIYNNGTCDTLTVDGIQRTGLSSISATGTTPARIAPGEYYEVRLVMTPGTNNNGTATFTLTGSMDTTFTVTMSTGSGGGGGGQAVVTMSIPDSTFSVEPCGTESQTMTIAASGGCSNVTIGRVFIESTFPNQTEFTVTGTTPVTLGDGQQAQFVVTYDASGNGNKQAFLVVEDGNGNEIRRIPLTGQVNGTTGVLSLRLEGEGGNTAFTKVVGEKLSVQIFSNEDVVAGHNLTEIAFDLAYTIDVMSSTASNGQNGWNANVQATPSGTRVVFTKDATVPHDRNLPLGQIEYTVRLAEEKTTALTIGDPTLNGGDAEYARCYMRPQPSAGTVTVTVNDATCYDDMVRNFMGGREYVSIIGIRPSTVLNGSQTSDVGVEYLLAGETAVKVTVQDQLGRIVAEQSTFRSAGSHTESLRIPSVEGIYFITLQTANGAATRKIVVE